MAGHMDTRDSKEMAENLDTKDSNEMSENVDTKLFEGMAGDSSKQTNRADNPPPYAPGYLYPAATAPPPVLFIPGQEPPPEGAPLGIPLTSSIPECPPGLEYLSQIDQLFLHPTGMNSRRVQYHIKDHLGEQIYLASEESEIIGTLEYSIVIHVTNNNRQGVMRALGSVKFGQFTVTPCFICCPPSPDSTVDLVLQTEAEQVIGHITARESTCYIQDADSAPILKYELQYTFQELHSDKVHELKAHDGSEVISKIIEQWSGFFGAPKYKIEFPLDMPVKTKATVLALALLLSDPYTAGARKTLVIDNQPEY